MKTTLFAMCFLFATAAFGQSIAGGSSLSSEPVIVEFASHPQKAMRTPLGAEESLLAPSNFTFAQGERPLWEVAPVSYSVPLGDVARAFRKVHAQVKKSPVVWVN
jgi:hypothetical protein